MCPKIKNENMNITKHYNENIESWKFEWFYEDYLNRLGVEKNKKLLDVGCGIGYLIKRAEMKGIKSYGVDISSKRVEIAKKKSPNSDVRVADAGNLPFKDNFFDYIICVGSLEHFPDMDSVLMEMKRVGKLSAEYLIVVPNSGYFTKRIKRKIKKQPIIHKRNLDEWKNLFFRNKFIVEKVFRDEGILPTLTFFRRNFFKFVRNVLPIRWGGETFWIYFER